MEVLPFLIVVGLIVVVSALSSANDAKHGRKGGRGSSCAGGGCSGGSSCSGGGCGGGCGGCGG